ncbi:MAG: hypothetical protein LQ344_003606 [Seirophora lacunosa]|nr:MAG: hypothetical protein LQ344_003606 [Seirophora lacunosa]
MSTRHGRPSRRRSRSPSNARDSPSHHHRHRRSPSPRPRSRPARSAPVTLPFGAQPLRKSHLETYKPMFGLYLDIQKQLILEDLEDREVRGRWKRFVGRWNRAELAEGWYDPDTLRKAQASAAAEDDRPATSRAPLPPARERELGASDRDNDDDASGDEDDGYGPAFPSDSDPHARIARREKPSGPSIPNVQDLQVQRESAAESSAQDRELLRYARKQDRRRQAEQLEDLAPRAAAGTKDRQLERKAELRASNAAFASAKADAAAGVAEEVPDADLMGDEEGGGGGLEGYRKKKAEEERRKNDREVRREEILRARREEREERVRVYRAKEERTMEGLVALARARFGPPGGG